LSGILILKIKYNMANHSTLFYFQKRWKNRIGKSFK